MRFASVAVLALSTVCSAAVLGKRDAAAVISSLGSLVSNVENLNGQLEPFTGDIFQALNIAIASEAIITATNQVTTDAQASTTFSAAESAQVTDALLAMDSGVTSNLLIIVEKKPYFAQYFIDPIVLLQLTRLRPATETMISAIRSKLAPAQASTAQSFGTSTLQKFDVAIAAYNTPAPAGSAAPKSS